MRALSLKEPYGSLVIYGVKILWLEQLNGKLHAAGLDPVQEGTERVWKDIENRQWKRSVRPPIKSGEDFAIHTSQKLDRSYLTAANEFLWEHGLSPIGDADVTLGLIIGIVTLDGFDLPGADLW